MEDLVAGDLKIQVAVREPATIELLWTGKSNARNPTAVLQPFFANVLAEATEKKHAIELHFEKLEHFNSSTITSIIQLIQDARTRGVKLTILFDHLVKWQKLSFDALRVFAKGDGLLELRPALSGPAAVTRNPAPCAPRGRRFQVETAGSIVRFASRGSPS
jgi:hypothetical protein